MKFQSVRSALRFYGHVHALTFSLAILLMIVHMEVLGSFRMPLLGLVGEIAFMAIFAIGSVMILFFPNVLVHAFLRRIPQLYCPQCGQSFTTLRTLRHLNKTAKCLRCEQGIAIDKPTSMQLTFDLAVFFGGQLMVILLVRWL